MFAAWGVPLIPFTSYLYRVNPTDLVRAEQDLNRHLSRAEIERVGQIKHRGNRNTTLLGRLLVRRVLAGILNCSALELVIGLRANGKPVLEGETVHFNLSHSHDWVLLGVGPRELGVDLEKVQYRDTLDALARHVMHQNEWSVYRAQAEQDKSSFFYRTWVLKEACLKFDGRGISSGLRSVETRLVPPEIVSHPGLRAEYLQAPESYCAAMVTSVGPGGQSYQTLIDSVFDLRS